MTRYATPIVLAGWLLWGTVHGGAPGTFEWALQDRQVHDTETACTAAKTVAEAAGQVLTSTRTDESGTKTVRTPRAYRCLVDGERPTGQP